MFSGSIKRKTSHEEDMIRLMKRKGCMMEDDFLLEESYHKYLDLLSFLYLISDRRILSASEIYSPSKR